MHLTTVRTIALMDVRRRWRVLKGNEMQLLALGLGIIFAVLFSVLGLAGLHTLGSLVAAGAVEDPVLASRTVAVYVWVFCAGFSAYLVYMRGLKPDNIDGLLTTVSHRDVIGGLVLSEGIVWGVPTVVYALLGSIAFGAGVRSPLAIPSVFVTLCALVGVGILSGYVIALAIKNTGVRSELLTRLRTLLFVVLGLVYLWALLMQSFGTVLDPIHRLLHPTPLSWYGDLALLGLGVDVSLVRALGALAVTGAAIPLGLAVLSRLAAWYWYVDPVHIDRGTVATDGPKLVSRLTTPFPEPVRGVVHVDWIRARRAPITLSFVLYPLFVLINPVMTTIETGTVSSSFPLWVLVCGAWITGSLFTLNVLGNEGAVLPVTALGTTSGRSLVYGHVLAGAMIGIPLTVGVTTVLALVSPLPVSSVATLGLAALVVAGCAGPVATGIGTVFPRFDTVRISRSREAVVPSFVGFVVYSAAISGIALPSILLHTDFFTVLITGMFDASPLTIALVGILVSGVLGTIAGTLSVRWAVDRVESFSFD